MRRSRSTQAQSMASPCRLTSLRGERLFMDAQWGLLWLAAKLHQGYATGSRDIQNGQILSGQPSYVRGFLVVYSNVRMGQKCPWGRVWTVLTKRGSATRNTHVVIFWYPEALISCHKRCHRRRGSCSSREDKLTLRLAIPHPFHFRCHRRNEVHK